MKPEIYAKAAARLGAALLLAAALTLTAAPPAPASVYITAEGDTAAQVARLTRCDPSLLAAVNGVGQEEPLPAGRLLTLCEEPALRHTVEAGDTLWALSRAYGCDPAQLAAVNGLEPPYLIFPGQSLLLPLAEEQSCLAGEPSDTVPVAAALYAPAEQALIWPVEGPVSSPFGEREEGYHWGVDIAVPLDTPVRAAASGTVVEAGWKNEGYGYAVLIDHGAGRVTLYGHCDEVLCDAGQWVEQGETVALSGSTGRSTGPHVHFELRQGEDWLDPLDYLP